MRIRRTLAIVAAFVMVVPQVAHAQRNDAAGAAITMEGAPAIHASRTNGKRRTQPRISPSSRSGAYAHAAPQP